MERALTRLWYGNSGGGALLQPLAWLYGSAIAFRRSAYARGWFASHRIARPVVVVGNLTVGGTGKTPLTVWLATSLRERGFKVGIVSRGYGRSETAPRAVDPEDDWRTVGDEPLLLRRHSGCPTVVGADRVAAAQKLAEQGVDVILADDGLQHLRLARDFELVVVDGARGFGNERLLPAGPLREGTARLASADAIVVTGKPAHSSLTTLAAALQTVASVGVTEPGTLEGTPVAALVPGGERNASNAAPGTAEHEPASARSAGSASPPVFEMSLEITNALPLNGGAAQPLDRFRGELVHAVAGIGNPARFFRELRRRGIEPVEHPFPDHHPFTAADLDFGDRLPVLMTEKDAVKCRSFADARLWQVPVTVRFSEAHARALLDKVTAKLKG
jgi:tetraacyldisaccharide 4'-kinase